MPEQHPHTPGPDKPGYQYFHVDGEWYRLNEHGEWEPHSPELRTHKASDILAAGGTDRYFAEKGIDNRHTSVAGLLDLTPEETRQALADLRRSEYKTPPLEDFDAEDSPDETPSEAELYLRYRGKWYRLNEQGHWERTTPPQE